MRYWKIGGTVEWYDKFSKRRGELIYVEDDQLIVRENERGIRAVWTRHAVPVWPRGEQDVRRWTQKMSCPHELDRLREYRAQWFRDNSTVRSQRELQTIAEAVKRVFT